MQPEQLSKYYPKLYHIAWGGSWPSIKENGLLSTNDLLSLYGKSEDEIRTLTQTRRADWVTIDCPGRPSAVIRDQKPLTDEGLRRALPDTVEPWQWYDLINSMVFFWPTKARLKTMISARAYQEVRHDVLVVNTEKLIQLEKPNIRLSRMNSGCTKPFPHKREMGLFKSFEDYPFDYRLRQCGRKRAVAEVCVLDRVDRIQEAVIDRIHGLSDDILSKVGV